MRPGCVKVARACVQQRKQRTGTHVCNRIASTYCLRKNFHWLHHRWRQNSCSRVYPPLLASRHCRTSRLFVLLIINLHIKISVPAGKRPLWRPAYRWEGNIKLDFTKKVVEGFCLRYDPVTDFLVNNLIKLHASQKAEYIKIFQRLQLLQEDYNSRGHFTLTYISFSSSLIWLLIYQTSIWITYWSIRWLTDSWLIYLRHSSTENMASNDVGTWVDKHSEAPSRRLGYLNVIARHSPSNTE
jgi:hypothetical protein